ncbi:MAG: hypothetical protein V3T86_09670 [Planctomycetota bacterium]
MSSVRSSLGRYLRIATRHTWMVLVPGVVIFAASAAAVIVQEDTYEASALLMPPLAKPYDSLAHRAVITQSSSLIRNAREYMLSTRVLRQLVRDLDEKELNPYADQRDDQGDRIVQLFQRNILVATSVRKGHVQVTFQHGGNPKSPEMVAAVVNGLCEEFIDKQRTFMDQEADLMTGFLQGRKADHTSDLEEAEKALTSEKEKYPGQLPENVENNRDRIDRLHDRILRSRDRISNNKLTLKSLVTESFRTKHQLEIATMLGSRNSNLDVIQGTLGTLRAELERKRVLFKEDSAAVQNLLKQIVTHETRYADEKLKQEGDDQLVLLYKHTLDESKKREAELGQQSIQLEASIKRDHSQIAALEEAILVGIDLESTFDKLVRNLNDAKRRRDSIRERLFEAGEARGFQAMSQATPIEIEQRAIVPKDPIGPKRIRMSLLGLAAGLAVGVGISVARSKLDRSYEESDDLRSLLPGTVLVTIPEVSPISHRVFRNIGNFVLGGTLLVVFGATLAVVLIREGVVGDLSMIEPLLDLLG